MFDLLKKKISSFNNRLKKKIEEKEAEEVKERVEEKEAVSKELEEVEGHRELKTRLSVKGKVKGLLTGKVVIEEQDLKELLWELELALLEADVEQETSEKICEEIKKELVGKKVFKRELDNTLKEEIKKILFDLMKTKQINLIEEVQKKHEKPFVILFLGPNGAGKTTTIAKLTHLLKENKKSVVWAASDTFRAASIEQLEKHALKLNVRVVKHSYGADPTAVAFDAVESAKAKNIDVVLIDTAGRQETNKNLMNELKKISRVIKPDLKIFVGEALSGQVLLQQASEFDKELGLNGFILTKIDTDAKGGTIISLLFKLKKPVLFVGNGQGYRDLLEFKPEYIIERVVG